LSLGKKKGVDLTRGKKSTLPKKNGTRPAERGKRRPNPGRHQERKTTGGKKKNTRVHPRKGKKGKRGWAHFTKRTKEAGTAVTRGGGRTGQKKFTRGEKNVPEKGGKTTTREGGRDLSRLRGGKRGNFSALPGQKGRRMDGRVDMGRTGPSITPGSSKAVLGERRKKKKKKAILF